LQSFPVAAQEAFAAWSQSLQRIGDGLCHQLQTSEISLPQLARQQLCLRSVSQLAWARQSTDSGQLLDLPSGEVCAESAMIIDDIALPPHLTEQQVLALRAEMAAIDAQIDQQDPATVLQQQSALLTTARSFQYTPLIIEALNQRAALAQSAGNPLEARRAVDEAIVMATQCNNRAALAHSHYINIMIQNDIGATVETDRSIALARAASAGQPPGISLRVELAAQVVAIHRGTGTAAVAVLTSMLEQCANLQTQAPVLCIDIHQALVAALYESKQIDALKARLPVLEQEIARQLGRASTRYAVFLANQIGIGSAEQSQTKAEAALHILQAHSPTHPKMITLLQNMGVIANNRGDDKLGLRYMTQALDAARLRFGRNSAAAAHLEINVATGLINLDDNNAALPLVIHAEQVMSNIDGGERNPFLAAARSMLAELHVGGGNNAAAYALLVPLVAGQQRPEADAAQRGRDEFLLAQVAWSLGHQPQAVEAAKMAVQDLTDAKEFPSTLASAKTWLAHPKRR
jgi:hypothetical protein